MVVSLHDWLITKCYTCFYWHECINPDKLYILIRYHLHKKAWEGNLMQYCNYVL